MPNVLSQPTYLPDPSVRNPFLQTLWLGDFIPPALELNDWLGQILPAALEHTQALNCTLIGRRSVLRAGDARFWCLLPSEVETVRFRETEVANIAITLWLTLCVVVQYP